MSTNRQTGNRRQETDLVLEVTPPEVGHLKIKRQTHRNQARNHNRRTIAMSVTEEDTDQTTAQTRVEEFGTLMGN